MNNLKLTNKEIREVYNLVIQARDKSKDIESIQNDKRLTARSRDCRIESMREKEQMFRTISKKINEIIESN